MRNLSPTRYLALLALFAFGLLAGVLTINCAVDPLWYLRGNLISGENFAFNERLQKINQFLKQPEAYDCVIFGSSRVTMLDERKVKRHRCFNLSFSAGQIGEFVAYASYLKRRGYRPKLVIVGVDGFNFFHKRVIEEVPDFVASHADPPGFLKNYLSLGALNLSIRALAELPPADIYRYYKRDFSVDILASAPTYDPGRLDDENPDADEPVDEKRFYPENVRWYGRLARMYPAAEVIFYVPPVSAWKVRSSAESGSLDCYLKGIHAVSKLAPVFDFSIPSAITVDAGRTYDGSHYDLGVNKLIAATINSGVPAFGIKINGLTRDDYRREFLDALAHWSAGDDHDLAMHGSTATTAGVAGNPATPAATARPPSAIQ